MTLFRTLLIMLGFCLCFQEISLALTSQEEAASQFVQGGLAYKEEKYEQAIEIYESIIEGKKESANIYYNLANAYFKINNLGKAVLNYERALTLSARDSAINFNYRYALGLVRSQGERGINPIQKILRDYTSYYTLDEMILMLMITMCILGVILLLSLYLKWERKMKVFISCMLGVIIFALSFGLMQKFQYEKNQAIILKQADANFEPRDNSTTHYEVTQGQKVKLLKRADGWSKIKRFDGKLGWVHQDTLEKI